MRLSKKFRYAVSRSRRVCWSTTDDTSPSHARSGVFFASVIRVLDRSPVFGNGSPSERAVSRALRASL